MSVAYDDNDDILGRTTAEARSHAAIEKAKWLDAVARDTSLSLNARAVALVISSYLNRKRGKAWPSSAELGQTCGRSPRQVIRLVDELEAAGYLEVEYGPNRGAGQRRCGYRLDLPARVALRAIDGGGR